MKVLSIRSPNRLKPPFRRVISKQLYYINGREYRYLMLKGDLAPRIQELVCQICELFEMQILRGFLSWDHAHILVCAPPNISMADIMRMIKERTSKKIYTESPQVKNRYWDGHFWARGYFCVRKLRMER